MPRMGPGDGSGGNQASNVPAGSYLLALVWFRRKRNKEGTADYLSCKYEVLAGPLKGSAFFSAISVDVSKAGTVTRWQIWMRVLELEEEFEIGDSAEGTDGEGDREISRLFQGKPFGAEVDRKTENGYVNNGIARYLFASRWLQGWDEAAEQWNERQSARGNPEDADDPDPDYVPSASSEVGLVGSPGDWDEDDDIPF